MTGCNAAALPIPPPAPGDDLKPVDLASSGCAQPIPRCGPITGVSPCLDAQGAQLWLKESAITSGGATEGPPVRCFKGAGANPTGLCQQDPTDVPAGYPYLLVADCGECAACAAGAP
jgi:hypothetical protein